MMARIVIAVALIGALVSPVRADDKLKVPNLVGKTVDDAQSAANGAGFPQDLYIETAGPDCKGAVAEKGKVKCQSPAPGTTLGRYEHITVYVVRPHEKKRITKDDTDGFIQLQLETTVKRLGELGYIGKITLRESEKCPMNSTCDIIPREFAEDDPITIVTKTKEKVEIAPPP